VSQETIDELSQQESELSRLKAAFLASIQDTVVCGSCLLDVCCISESCISCHIVLSKGLDVTVCTKSTGTIVALYASWCSLHLIEKFLCVCVCDRFVYHSQLKSLACLLS